MTTPQDLDERFRAAVAELAASENRRGAAEPVRDGSRLSGERATALFDAQLTARHLDLAARWLLSFGEAYRSIGSAGHEGDAAVAAAVHATDPALLQPRSVAFLLARAAGGSEVARDVLRGVVASAYDPGSGGRLAVPGSAAFNVVPSTIDPSAHLPRAFGLAAALTGGGRKGRDPDAIVVASFCAGSVDDTALTAALTAAGRYDHHGVPLPLLLICEDDGLAGDWPQVSLSARPGLRYTTADGCDLAAAYDAATDAADWVREHRRPAVLQLSTVRLLTATADTARDPLLRTAALLVEAGLTTPDDVLARYDELGWQIRKLAEEVIAEPKLASGADIVAPLAPRRPLRVARAVADAASRATGPAAGARHAAFAGRLPEDAGPLTLAQTLDAALTDALVTQPGAVAVGSGDDDVTTFGLALGAGLAAQLPIVEVGDVRRVADQLGGEAATLLFRSAGAYRNPMVIRLPGLARDPAQPDTGPDGDGQGDDVVPVLSDVPGLVVAVPARPADAAALLRSCLASAAVDGSVCVLVEPVAGYHLRDLHESGDNGWLAPYAAPAKWAAGHIPAGRARTYGVGSADDLTILTFGNGVRMSLRAAHGLALEGYGSRVVDLRWLAPLPVADLVRESAATGRVLIVDETRRTGGVGETVLAALVDGGFVGAVRRIAAADTFVPPGPAARHVLIGANAITQGAHALLTG